MAAFETPEASRLLATYEASESKRHADVVSALESKRVADLAALEATLEAKHSAALSVLEAKRSADLAAYEAALEARPAERSTTPRLPFPKPLISAKVVPTALVSRAAGECARAGPHHRPRWRVSIVLGLVVVSGIGAAAFTAIGRKIVERKNQERLEAYECHVVRDTISDWGKRLAIEAATLASMILHERNASDTGPKTPFLVPGRLANELQQERLERMADEFQQTPPAVVWYPTVRLEDRAAYEAYATGVYGAAVSNAAVYDGGAYGAGGRITITDERTQNAFQYAEVSAANLVLAPPRPTYNPSTCIWRSAGAEEASRDPLEVFLGLDSQERFRRVLPSALETKFLDDKELVAHPFYLSDGEALADYGIAVLVPVLDEACYEGGGCFYDDDIVLAYVSFSLRVERWASIFPVNLMVQVAATGQVIKTVEKTYVKHAHAHEPVLGLDLECFYNVRGDIAPLYAVAALALGAIVGCLWFLRRLELGAARDRRLANEQRKDAAREAAAAEQRKDERIRYSFEVSEKTERYLNHELKNRIFVLGQSCDVGLYGQLEEMTEVLSSKAALMRLSTGRYKPLWDAVEPAALIDRRWQRFVAANSPFERAPTAGAAADRNTLRLDKVLFDIILDNILSNSFKYGDASRPPTLGLRLEPLDEGATRVKLSLELRNWAGLEHAALLQMGEEKLNEIAHADGQRAHEHTDEVSSGDGFPMAAAAAKALGGTVRLVLLNNGVVAKLELPDVAVVLPAAARGDATATATPVDLELSWLKIALADDSAMFRKMISRLAENVTSKKPVVAGETRESIDNFSKLVVESDCDVVFLDFNFAPVHHTKTGIDICRECRALDAEEGNVPRLIYIVSANDSPEDAERYRAAGADGSLSKKLSAKKLRAVLEDAVRTHPRFAAYRRGDLNSSERRQDRAQGPRGQSVDALLQSANEPPSSHPVGERRASFRATRTASATKSQAWA